MVTLPLGRRLRPPSDRLGSIVRKLLSEPSAVRDRFAENIYVAAQANNPIGQMEKILPYIIEIEPLEKKIKKAEREGSIQGHNFLELVAAAAAKNILTPTEAEKIRAVDEARMAIIMVDDFPADIFREMTSAKPNSYTV